MNHPTIDKLHALRLTAMADAFQAQLGQPELAAIPFEERFALLVDCQHTANANAALAQRLRRAGMRQTACLENLDHGRPGQQPVDPPASQRFAGRSGRRRQKLDRLRPGQSCRTGRRVGALQAPAPPARRHLAVARLHGRQARMLAGLARTRLLILDDWAMVKLTAEQRRDLIEVVDDRHGRGSTIVATQIPLDHWHDQIGEPGVS